MDIETIDLEFLGNKELIGSSLLRDRNTGVAALIESGPTTCLGRLMEGLREREVSPEEIEQVFLTHIHLDHAGGSGNLSELLPNATFYVHELGFPHLVDPSKLLKSASRIYRDQMEYLWGEVRPVPENRIRSLSGGEELVVAGGTLTAHYTPGHAYHHLAFYEPESGALFAGDVAGVRLPGQSYVKPPTPPPEVDVEAWKRSIELIKGLRPESLWLAHFGSYSDVERHMGELEQRLIDWLLFVEKRLDKGHSQADISDDFQAYVDEEIIGAGGGETEVKRYDTVVNYEMLFSGLMRYVTDQHSR